jgi:hypothetical protein
LPSAIWNHRLCIHKELKPGKVFLHAHENRGSTTSGSRSSWSMGACTVQVNFDSGIEKIGVAGGGRFRPHGSGTEIASGAGLACRLQARRIQLSSRCHGPPQQQFGKAQTSLFTRGTAIMPSHCRIAISETANGDAVTMVNLGDCNAQQIGVVRNLIAACGWMDRTQLQDARAVEPPTPSSRMSPSQIWELIQRYPALG